MPRGFVRWTQTRGMTLTAWVWPVVVRVNSSNESSIAATQQKV